MRVGTDTEVEPDLMVRPRPAERPQTWETASLPLLAIEVRSDTTRRRDRVDKRALYRDFGIPDYWMSMAIGGSFVPHDLASMTWMSRPCSHGSHCVAEPFVLDLAAYFAGALVG